MNREGVDKLLENKVALGVGASVAGGPLGPDANDKAAHRPTGIAQGPDGALYITDDKGGRVWRVVYKGAAK